MNQFRFYLSLFGLACISVFSQPSLSHEAIQVISDVDDTIRIIHVGSYYDVLKNAFYSQNIFDGTQVLYDAFFQNKMELVYLSGSPQSLQSRLENLLFSHYQMPRGRTILSNWWEWKTSGDFKRGQLKHLIQDSDSRFILIGDDTESDPEVYSELKAGPDGAKILKIYIHQMKGRPLPNLVTGFSTVFDVALNESEENRLDVSQVLNIGHSILKNQDQDLLFPYFKYCPVDYEIRLSESMKLNSDVVNLVEQMNHFVREVCVTKKR